MLSITLSIELNQHIRTLKGANEFSGVTPPPNLFREQNMFYIEEEYGELTPAVEKTVIRMRVHVD